MRITLYDVRQSRLPNAIGVAAGNTPAVAAAVNAAQKRLIDAGGETGWWGGWTRAQFQVSTASPYLTLPRQFARMVQLAWCHRPAIMHNEFYRMLPGSTEDYRRCMCRPLQDWCGQVEGYDWGVFPTMVDLPATSYLRVYPSDATDAGKTLLIQGLDANGLVLRSTAGEGEVITLASPFSTSVDTISQISAIQKDITTGDVVLKAVDPTTLVETALARYSPTEVNPAYRRYRITHFPNCAPCTGLYQVWAMCKFDYTPVYRDTDQLVIGNIEALVEECQAIRLSGMETATGLAMSGAHHAKAIRLLQNELRHYVGEQTLAASVSIWGSAALEHQNIGTLI